VDQRQRDELRFRDLYRAHYRALQAFARRRCADPADAHDVVAETFLVLWRRIGEAPDGEEALLWLFGVARRVVANQRRSQTRRDRLTARLRALPQDPLAVDSIAFARADAKTVLRAMARLSERDREVLLLAAWEGLSHAQIARVLGCSENAAMIRLHRARVRLRELCAKENVRPGHERTTAENKRHGGDADERP
jgi:RNA polymerase sigma-70 factor (ECF subfamily)